MQRHLRFSLLFLAISLAGCGSSADKLAQNSLSVMQELTTAIERGDKAAILAAAKKMQAIGKESKEMKLSPEDTKRMQEKYKTQFEEQGKKLMQAMMKASTEGKLKPEDMQEISKAMQEIK